MKYSGDLPNARLEPEIRNALLQKIAREDEAKAHEIVDRYSVLRRHPLDIAKDVQRFVNDDNFIEYYYAISIMAGIIGIHPQLISRYAIEPETEEERINIEFATKIADFYKTMNQHAGWMWKYFLSPNAEYHSASEVEKVKLLFGLLQSLNSIDEIINETKHYDLDQPNAYTTNPEFYEGADIVLSFHAVTVHPMAMSLVKFYDLARQITDRPERTH